ncbi:unnamed protein product [Candida verbasci]|uniref:Uncharacterized protein n=1 Tax=Candida verbasci TaxID=1227364 RepID=A0A9W4X8Q1_9ASCO|nr:unnamed protein product [Candida verbasci]
MRLNNIIIFYIISLVYSLAMQDDGDDNTDTTNTSQTPTSVWVTTTIGGSSLVIQTTYQQSFMSSYTEANTEDVKQGSVGLGSLSNVDSVGSIRSYSQTTISSQGDAAQQWLGSSSSIYTGIFGGLFIILGLI